MSTGGVGGRARLRVRVGVPCMVRSYAWVIVTWDPHPAQNDGQT